MEPAIAVMVDGSASFGRGVLVGIDRYLREHAGSGVLFFGVRLPPASEDLAVRGLIVQGAQPSPEWPEGPVVNISGRPKDLPPYSVVNDDEGIGRMAAEFFLERHFKHFAYVGIEGHGYSNRRGRGFASALGKAGFEPQILEFGEIDNNADVHRDKTYALLLSSPRPLAIFACNDKRARRVIRFCMDLRINVPEEVAVLGVDDDQYESMRSPIPIASIQPNSVQIGYEAATLLNRLMHGEKVDDRPMLIPPLAAVGRQSADILGVDDDELREALQYIRLNYKRQIGVQDLVDHLVVSRRRLERSFTRHLGRTPLCEIRRMRVAAAKRLLACTDLTVAQVAREAGFLATARFIVVFKEETGLTPLAFRMQQRRGITAKRAADKRRIPLSEA